ncbi:MAG: outer membrane beta-barrel protein [Deltaproteobacteria bacterium]|nr:outer membrane beta-barrel protein [Deltaproteobacteria bacterium]MDQ3298159.1 hypothetical protein [Myxococcota bacterium]
MRAISSLVTLAVFAIPVLAPTPAAARPITLGIAAGVSHSEVDADTDGHRTLGLFGRVGFSKRVSGQLEIVKFDTDAETNYDNTTIRTGTALLVVDLLDRGELMPVLFAGLGIDRAENDYTATKGTHIEGGLGLEYRSRGGLTIGLDLRLGGRSIEETYETQPVDTQPILPRLAPARLQEGEYRAGRITIGVKF